MLIFAKTPIFTKNLNFLQKGQFLSTIFMKNAGFHEKRRFSEKFFQEYNFRERVRGSSRKSDRIFAKIMFF
jgi:hypothetical protein